MKIKSNRASSLKFNRLSHSKHITDYHFFIFYEFEIPEEIRELSSEEIIEKFIKSYYFTDEFYECKDERESELTAHGAFLTKKLTTDDFRKSKGKDVEKVVLSEIEKEGWEAADEIVREEFSTNFIKSKHLLDYMKIDNDEIFYLDKDWFTDTDKLIEIDFIYDYFLTFISINQSKKRLLQFDYGFD